MKLRITLLAAATFWLAASPLARADTVDVALVLALDVSESVTEDEYALQRDGIAEAFESPALVSAVANGSHHAIDVLVLEWSDPELQVVTVDWTRVRDTDSARDFARKVRATKRTSHGLTAIGNALMASAAALKRLPDQAARKVIDVSGDGMANVGPPVPETRDALTAEGITINGLTILHEEPWVDQYYDMNVIGGPGAFVMQVTDYRGFAAAIRQKLLSELVALPRPGAFPPT